MSKNPFEEMIPEAELPKDHKKQVMDSLELAGLMLDFWDLFTTRRFNISTEMFQEIQENTRQHLKPKSEDGSKPSDSESTKDTE